MKEQQTFGTTNSEETNLLFRIIELVKLTKIDSISEKVYYTPERGRTATIIQSLLGTRPIKRNQISR